MRPMIMNFESCYIPEPNSGCWIWTRATNRAGYGVVWNGKRTILAHRHSYELVNGSAGSLFVLHKCDNPSCVNPAHLYAGTHTDNMRDMDSKNRRRSSSRWGEQLPYTKLRISDVLAIREAAASITHSSLAKKYGVDPSQISNIRRYLQWRNV